MAAVNNGLFAILIIVTSPLFIGRCTGSGCAFAVGDGVVTKTALAVIRAIAAVEQIIATTAIEDVATAATHDVIATEPVERILAAEGQDQIIHMRAGQGFTAAGAHDDGVTRPVGGDVRAR